MLSNTTGRTAGSACPSAGRAIRWSCASRTAVQASRRSPWSIFSSVFTAWTRHAPRAAGGAGLGLSIVHDMVERSYGTITVQARSGGGTIFTVRFPHFDLEEDET
ncbi:MAG: ATP-binding protein [Oscillospiraceae bacterium]